MIKRVVLFLPLLLPASSLAQQTATMTVTLPPAVHFWTALIAGILLAFAFQLVLTGLSAAAGISAIGMKTRPAKGEAHSKSEKPKGSQPWAASAIKLESGAGVWVLLTTSIALFFAAWLGVVLGRPTSLLAGAATGLAIWAGFLLITLVFESRITGSLLGSIISTATGLFESTVATVRGMLDSRMAHRQMVQTAEEITAAVRREIMEGVDTQGITEKLDEYVSRLQPPPPGGAPPPRHEMGHKVGQAIGAGRKVDISKAGEWLKGVKDDQQLMALIRMQNVQLDRDDVAGIVSRHTPLPREQVDQLIDKLLQAWETLAGRSEQARQSADDTQARIQKMKQYFRDTGRSELNPDRFAQEFSLLLKEPAAGLAALGRHAREIDRDSIAEILRQRKDLSESEIQRLADEYATQYHHVWAQIERADAAAQDAKDQVLERLRRFLDTFAPPELDYEGIRRDFMLLFDDPRAGFEALKARLMGIDRETLINIIRTNRKLSHEDAERLLATAEKARDDVLGRAERIRDETNRRIGEAREQSLAQLDQSRKVVAAAAWWLFAILVVSGIAALIGGIVGATVAT